MPKQVDRPIRVKGDIAYVPLTSGKEAIIDAADVPLVEKLNWFARRGPYTFYAGTNVPGIISRQKTILMHRLLIDAPHGLLVDHINGDGLDNRRSNLRLATMAQNQHNVGLRRDNASGFKGVMWHKRSARWRAAIVCNGRKIHLGGHKTAEAAYDAYVEASKLYHGPYGRAAAKRHTPKDTTNER